MICISEGAKCWNSTGFMLGLKAQQSKLVTNLSFVYFVLLLWFLFIHLHKMLVLWHCFVPKITSSVAIMHSTIENIFAYFIPYHCHDSQSGCITLSADCVLNLVLCCCNYISLVLLCNRPPMLWHNLALYRVGQKQLDD